MYLRHLQNARMMSADTEGSGGSQNDPDAVKDGQTFSHEYVRELRAENKGWRLKASEMEKTASSAREAAEKAAADLKATSEKAKADLDNQVKEVRSAADARVVRYALHAAAKTAGMVDLDGLKLLDTSTVKVGEDGEVSIPEDFFTKAKESKPYLFGAAGSTTTNPATPPKPAQTAAKSAAEMTDEEYAAAKAAITRIGR